MMQINNVELCSAVGKNEVCHLQEMFAMGDNHIRQV